MRYKKKIDSNSPIDHNTIYRAQIYSLYANLQTISEIKRPMI